MTSDSLQPILRALALGLHRDSLLRLATLCRELAGSQNERKVALTLAYLAFVQLFQRWEGEALTVEGTSAVEARLVPHVEKALEDPTDENLAGLCDAVLWSLRT